MAGELTPPAGRLRRGAAVRDGAGRRDCQAGGGKLRAGRLPRVIAEDVFELAMPVQLDMAGDGPGRFWMSFGGLPAIERTQNVSVAPFSSTSAGAVAVRAAEFIGEIDALDPWRRVRFRRAA